MKRPSLNAVALVAVAVWFRCHDLGNLPGINGDEAWYGVQAELVLHGEPITWRTPTGNLLNLLFFGPQLLLHAMFEPSVALLRATAVASGILALAVNFWLCRGVFGRQAAAISTVILAVLPINIVYSRLAWDASQSLMLTLPAIYWPLRALVDPPQRTRFSALGLIALVAAILVHPTNLFVAPIAGVSLVLAWQAELKRIWRPALGKAATAIAAIGFAAVLGNAAASHWPSTCERLTNPAEYGAFGINLGRMFSGATVYEYVSGAIAPTTSGELRWAVVPYDLAAGFAAFLLGWGFYRQLTGGLAPPNRNADGAMDGERVELDQSRGRSVQAALALGWGLSLAAFFLIAGPAAIAPHFERYGICLIGPAVVLASLGVRWWFDRPGGIGRLAAAVSIVLGWTMLASFQANFFDFFRENGGQSHRTFRTASVEPKQAAFDYILAHSNNEREIRILTTEWWTYWPLRYLALGQSQNAASREIAVEQYTELPGPAARRFRSATRIWLVEFAESPACKGVRRWSRAENVPITEATICDFGGQPLLCIFRVDGIWEKN